MKKNNTAEKSILKADKISKALKENTEKTLRDLVNETISNLILEEEAPEEDDENEYEVEDVEVENDSEVADDVEVDDTEDVDAPETDEDGETDEWSDFDEFKTDDNEWDITNQDEKGEEILQRMYNMLEDGDELIVTKNGDALEVSNEETGESETFEMSDDESFDLPGEESEDEFEVELDDEDSEDEDEFEVEFDDEESDNEDEDEIEVDLDDEDSDNEDEFEFEIEDSEDDELTESYGYTTEYQGVTAMETPKNSKKPLKGTHERDVVPREKTQRHGKSKGDPKPYGCCENDDMTSGEPLEEARTKGSARLKHKGMFGNNGNRVPDGSQAISDVEGYHATYKKIKESYEKVIKENEALKESVKATKKSLMEAAILNVNLGKIVNLLVNETTTRDEKKSILSRFNEVKTINEGTMLYNTIKKELNETKRTSLNLDRTVVAESKQNLNETTFYADRSKNPSLALMDRMDNLYKK
jgi:hypothetical protein